MVNEFKWTKFKMYFYLKMCCLNVFVARRTKVPFYEPRRLRIIHLFAQFDQMSIRRLVLAFYVFICHKGHFPF